MISMTMSTSISRSGSGCCPRVSDSVSLRPIWSEVAHVDPRDIFRDVFQEHAPSLTRPEDYINHSLYFEAKTFLNGLLLVEDKLSMAHGLETRVPFLDNDLVDFAMRAASARKARQSNGRHPSRRKRAGRKERALLSRKPAMASFCSANDVALHSRANYRACRSKASRRPTRAGSRAKASITCGGLYLMERRVSMISWIGCSAWPHKRSPRRS